MMKTILKLFLSEFEFYRRWHGGKWARTIVDFPVCSLLWLDIPDWADENYREPLWRCTPSFKNYNVKPL